MNTRTILVRSIAALLAISCVLSLAAADVLIPTGATWKYLDNGSNQGTAWRSPAFNDTSWASGPAQLGYGDGDEATVVSYGPNSGAKYITTYFRRSFNVADTSAYLNATVRVLRDDGAVVYVNGTEVFRSNMPGGGVGYQTLASAAIDDVTFFSASFSPGLLVNGANVVAVEIHQANGTSSDISFDLDLTASTATTAPVVVRGPYLQSGTPSSVIVRWRTDIATDSRVCFGTVQGTLGTCVSDATAKTEHQITLTGLSADTRYYYSVGNAAGVLAGNDANHFVVTHPPAGVSKPTRIWVLGDAGTATSSQQAVRNAYYTFTGSRHTDLWLMLGDNAYNSGTDSEFQAAVFNMYPEMLRKSVLWSTRGNHESTDASGSVYYNIHNFPTAGQAGGEPSGTEAYYSWDYGNIHFICLDSFGSSRSATGPMANWLKADLAANTRQWTVAFWHHPPYTKGSHNSDNEIELIEMRQNFLPILEDGGVDLVLSGHSHSYERSFLLDGHYGGSSTLTAANKKDGGNGREDGTGAYQKATDGPASHEGAVYVVAGSSGQASGGLLNHPAMFISLNNLGSLVMDVDTNHMDVKFVRETGATGDYFALIKGGAATLPPAPTGLAATPGNGQVVLNWSAASGATSYNVKRATVSGGPYTTIATGVTSTTFTNTGLNNGTTYYFVVSASNNGGESPNSAEASAMPQAPAAPAAPTGLAATPGNGQAVLNWSAASGATSYNVKRATVSGGPYTTIATGVTSTSFTNTGLNNGTTYYFVVSASNSGGEGSNSTQVSATPQAPAAPNAPTALTATGAKNKITLRWTQSTSPNLQYNRVYRSNTSGGPYTLVAQFAPKTSYNDPVASGLTRYYVITAVNTSGVESPSSNQASATAK